jgi:putative adenylate-forming enzyme
MSAFATVGAALGLIGGYYEARASRRARTRAELEALQAKRLASFRAQVLPRSPFYAPLAREPFSSWPIMTKRKWMQEFDRINTAGITLAEAAAVAERAERSRDFAPTVRGVTVGMSTGTSGARGVFLVGDAERARWAGAMLAKVLGAELWRPQRVALLLRANSRLYESVGLGPIRFRYFDLTCGLDAARRDLERFAPTVLVAPAHVLALLARDKSAGTLALAPRRAISVAEVLDPLDRARIERAFGLCVEQIYQATEGFLAATCRHGSLHLNEEHLIVEREWLDAQRTRFVPVITDLFRSTQPIVRYRLNDVLVPRREPCECGAAALALERVEGREDDLLWLAPLHGTRPVPVFADVLARAVVRTLPALDDYSIEELERGRWRVGLAPPASAPDGDRLRGALAAAAAGLGAAAPLIELGVPAVPAGHKLRRIRRAEGAGVTVSAQPNRNTGTDSCGP